MKKLVILSLFLLVNLSIKAQQADLVFTGGNIITLKQKGDRANAIAIKAGKILAVGSDKQMQKYIGKSTRVVALKGKTVIPGFNDVHQHPSPVYTFDKRMQC